MVKDTKSEKTSQSAKAKKQIITKRKKNERSIDIKSYAVTTDVLRLMCM